MSSSRLTLRVDDLCDRVSVAAPEVREMVACGIISPLDSNADDWEFDPGATAQLARAVRLQRDLHLDWQGVALALHLLQEIEALRLENRDLRQRLARHEH